LNSTSSSPKRQETWRDIVERKDDTPTTSSVLSSPSVGRQRDIDLREVKRPTVGDDSLDTSMSAEPTQSTNRRSTKRKPSSSPQKAVRSPPAVTPPTEKWYPTPKSKKRAYEWLTGFLETKIAEGPPRIKNLPEPARRQCRVAAISVTSFYTDPSKPAAPQVISAFDQWKKGSKNPQLQKLTLKFKDFPADFYQQ
jgi:hypothetical protein